MHCTPWNSANLLKARGLLSKQEDRQCHESVHIRGFICSLKEILQPDTSTFRGSLSDLSSTIVDSLNLSSVENLCVHESLQKLKWLNSLTKELQCDASPLTDDHVLFDAIMCEVPQTKSELYLSAGIIQYPLFVLDIVMINKEMILSNQLTEFRQ